MKKTSPLLVSCVLIGFTVSGCNNEKKESTKPQSEVQDRAQTALVLPASVTSGNDTYSQYIRETDRNAKNNYAALNAEEGKPSLWKYEKEIDKMTSKETRFAHLQSVNELNFNPPYDGGSYGSLMVRQRKSDGLKVLFSISKGQMICHSSCALSVRFDDKPSMKFTASTPADYSSTSVFLSPASKFVSELKKSKKIIIEGNYYQSGSQISEFKTENFEWN